MSTRRKLLLKIGCLLMLVLGMPLPKLEARTEIPKLTTQRPPWQRPPWQRPPSDWQYDYRIKLVHGWLYNYCEKPYNTEIKMRVEKLTGMIDKFQRRRKRYNSEEQWLKDIFYQVHRKLLKCYESPSTIPE